MWIISASPSTPTILRSKVGVFVDAFRKARALADLNLALQREIAQREDAQAALQRANQELEYRVRERTNELTRANREVRENEERLSMALEVARIGAWEWDLSSGQMRWSADPERLFGFPEGSFGEDKRIVRAIHPDDHPHVEAAVSAALRSGVYEAEYRAVRQNGSVAWIKERGRVVLDTDGGRMVGISRDITAERMAAGELDRLLTSERQARDEAERQSRLKDEFLAILSHELRTPMNVILGWIDILITGKSVRDVPSVLAVLQRNAKLQARMIEELLDMSRLASGNITLDLARVDIASILHATIEGLAPTAEARFVQVHETTPPEGLELEADARRIEQVLRNVLDNAIKFTPAGGHVCARAERVGTGVSVTIEDDGCGISPSFLPFVFERFRQEDAGTNRQSSGLGLGLAIVKNLVELHRGTVTADSDGTGRGSTFTVHLPARP